MPWSADRQERRPLWHAMACRSAGSGVSVVRWERWPFGHAMAHRSWVPPSPLGSAGAAAIAVSHGQRVGSCSWTAVDVVGSAAILVCHGPAIECVFAASPCATQLGPNHPLNQLERRPVQSVMACWWGGLAGTADRQERRPSGSVMACRPAVVGWTWAGGSGGPRVCHGPSVLHALYINSMSKTNPFR